MDKYFSYKKKMDPMDKYFSYIKKRWIRWISILVIKKKMDPMDKYFSYKKKRWSDGSNG